MRTSITPVALALLLAACPGHPPAGTRAVPAPSASNAQLLSTGRSVAQIRKDARAYAPLAKSPLVAEFLAAADDLPAVPTRRLWHDADKKRYWTDADASHLAQADRRTLTSQAADEELYYVDRYGTPMAYARPLELLGLARDALVGKRVIDFGFGAPGHLRILASLGARVTGIDVDPLSRALYTAPGDQGPIHGRLGQDGDMRLLFGAFPADPAIVEAVGGGYDLFLSKNVLKRGYIHPERYAPPSHLIVLGVDDEAFVRRLHAVLVPGGKVLIYNFTPPLAPPDKPYIPWADGRCPFAREVWENAGFRVIDFDRDDTPAAKAMGHVFEWDKEDDGGELYATYTLAERLPG
jgi:hypothetical protein